MKYKKRVITVKKSNAKANPHLYKSMPFSYKIKGRGALSEGQIYTECEVIMNISYYLAHNPEFIILKNKRLPKGAEVLKETLDKMVKEHNLDLEQRKGLALKLGIGKKHLRERRVERFLKKASKEKTKNVITLSYPERS